MKLKNSTCGSCLFHTRDKVFAQPCHKMGKVSSSVSCGSFMPNGFDLAVSEMDALTSISSNIHNMSGRDLKILGALLLREESTRRYGYKFHQKVYIRIQGAAGANYVSNFVTARVVLADKESVRVVSESGKICVTLMNEKDSHTIYTAARFAEIRSKMFQEKKFVDPSIAAHAARRESIITEGIPTLDKAFKAGDLMKLTAKRRLKVENLTDFERFVARLSKGHTPIVKKSKSKNTSEALTFDYANV